MIEVHTNGTVLIVLVENLLCSWFRFLLSGQPFTRQIGSTLLSLSITTLSENGTARWFENSSLNSKRIIDGRRARGKRMFKTHYLQFTLDLASNF
jgi:hypothetical protein